MKKHIYTLLVLSLIALSAQAQWSKVSATNPTVLAGGSTTAQFVVHVNPGVEQVGSLGADITISSGTSALDITSFSISPDPGPMTTSGSGTSRTVSGGIFPEGDYTITYTLQDNGTTTNYPVSGFTNLQIFDYANTETYGINNDNTSLPVTLISFNATKEGKTAQLAWKTSNETKSSHFEVEHSTTAKKWAVAATVKTFNAGEANQEYTQAVKSVKNGVNYFRLKMVDLDGSYSYSNIRSLEFSGIDEELVTFGPNPSTDYFTINASDAFKLESVKLYDRSGRMVYSSGALVDKTVSVKNLASGIYVLKLTAKDGEVNTKKVLVNR